MNINAYIRFLIFIVYYTIIFFIEQNKEKHGFTQEMIIIVIFFSIFNYFELNFKFLI
jgi:hypothetical protein